MDARSNRQLLIGSMLAFVGGAAGLLWGCLTDELTRPN